MDLLISIIIYIAIFCLVAWGARWIIVTYALPQPILVVVGVALLIVLLLFAAKVAHGGFPVIKLT
jgi:hypothetical protein